MYGYLRPEGKHGRTPAQKQQCALCHVYKRHYSQRARLLAGYDPATLLLLVEALVPEPPPRARVRCPLPPFGQRTATDPEWPAARAVAALQLFLAGEKLFDDRVDQDARLSRLAERALRRNIEHAHNALREDGFDVDGLRQILRSQPDREADPQADFDTLSAPTRKALEDVTRFAAATAECPPETVHAASRFGAALGSTLYLVDALNDVRKDLKSNTFNPVLHLLGRHLSPRSLRFLLDLFEGRLRELDATLKRLPLHRHRDALTTSTVDSLSRRGRAALEHLPAPATALRLAGVTP